MFLLRFSAVTDLLALFRFACCYVLVYGYVWVLGFFYWLVVLVCFCCAFALVGVWFGGLLVLIGSCFLWFLGLLWLVCSYDVVLIWVCLFAWVVVLCFAVISFVFCFIANMLCCCFFV